MSVRPHPSIPGWWIIDYRPEGYKGKRVRVPFEGTESQALDWERKAMRRGVEGKKISVCDIVSIGPVGKYYLALKTILIDDGVTKADLLALAVE